MRVDPHPGFQEGEKLGFGLASMGSYRSAQPGTCSLTGSLTLVTILLLTKGNPIEEFLDQAHILELLASKFKALPWHSQERVSGKARGSVVAECYSVAQFLETPHKCDHNSLPCLCQLPLAACLGSPPALAQAQGMAFKRPLAQSGWAQAPGL